MEEDVPKKSRPKKRPPEDSYGEQTHAAKLKKKDLQEYVTAEKPAVKQKNKLLGLDTKQDNEENQINKNKKKATLESTNENGEDSTKNTVEKEVTDKGSAKDNFRLIVKSIALHVDQETLQNEFEKCGTVKNLKLLQDSDGKSRGIAFVTYESKDAFTKALEYNNVEYAGRRLKVQRAEEKGAPSTTEGNGAQKIVNPSKLNLRLMLKNLPTHIDEEMLRRDFEECGAITNLKLLCDRDGQSKGMAFVTYADEAGYFAALEYNSTDYGGRQLKVQKAEDKGSPSQSLGPRPPGCNSIVLKKLSPDVTSDDLQEFFRGCGGGPKKVGLLTDRSGISRCTARIDFGTESAVDDAVKLAGTALKGNPVVMEFCKPKTC